MVVRIQDGRRIKGHLFILTNLLVIFNLSFLPLGRTTPVVGREYNLLRRFEISSKKCSGMTGPGTRGFGACMFNFQCHQQGGKVIGTCVDGFLFGACCYLPSESLDAFLNKVEFADSTLTHEVALQDVEQNLEDNLEHNLDHQSVRIDEVLLPLISDLVTVSGGAMKGKAGEQHKLTLLNLRNITQKVHKGPLAINAKEIFTSISNLRPENSLLTTRNKHSTVIIEDAESSTEILTTLFPIEDQINMNGEESSKMKPNSEVTTTVSSIEPVSTDIVNKIITDLIGEFPTIGLDSDIDTTPYDFLSTREEDKWVVISSSSDEKTTNDLILRKSLPETTKPLVDVYTSKTQRPSLLLRPATSTKQKDKDISFNVSSATSFVVVNTKKTISPTTEMLATTQESTKMTETTRPISTTASTTTTTTAQTSTKPTLTAKTTTSTPNKASTTSTNVSIPLNEASSKQTSKAPPSTTTKKSHTTKTYSKLKTPTKTKLPEIAPETSLPKRVHSKLRPPSRKTTTPNVQTSSEKTTQPSKVKTSPQASTMPKTTSTPKVEHSTQIITTMTYNVSKEDVQLQNKTSTTQTTTSKPLELVTSSMAQIVQSLENSTTINNHSNLIEPDHSNPLAIWTTKKPDKAQFNSTLKQPPISVLNQTQPSVQINTAEPTKNSTGGLSIQNAENLLFWTTRRPLPTTKTTSTSQNSYIYIKNGTVSESPIEIKNKNNSLHASSDAQNIYDDVIQQLTSNLMNKPTVQEELSTEAWGSSTYPIFSISYDIVNNTRVPVLKTQDYIKISGSKPVENANPNKPSVLSSVTMITKLEAQPDKSNEVQASNNDTLLHKFDIRPNTTKTPPINMDLLMQLLNLTSYIPEAGVFIPPHLLTTTKSPEAEDLEAALYDLFQSSNTIPPSPLKTTKRPTIPPIEITIPTEAPVLSKITKRPARPTTRATLKRIATTTTKKPTTRKTKRRTTTTTKPTTKKWNWRKTCGVRPLVREARIVNGRRSDFGEWPWQALVRESTWLGIFTKNKCGGVLLNNKYVLTAAHCQPGFLASLIVVLGELDVSGNYEPKKTVQKNVRRVVVHKDFVPKTFDNDLALLELETPVDFDEHILPICMPPKTSTDDFVGRIGFVSGWGRLSYQGSIPNLLHTVEVPVIPNAECQQWFRESGHSKTIKPEFICAGYKDGKKDSCEGDSGGPLSIRKEDGRWVLAGIVSHGIKCAYPNLPGVYMRMTYYKPWIDKVMNT